MVADASRAGVRHEAVSLAVAAPAVALASLGVAAWPAFTALLAGVALVAALARSAPAAAFVLAATLFAFEGTIKILLRQGENPLGVRAEALGAAALDLALGLALLGLVGSRRELLVDLWGRLSRGGRVGVALVAAWVLASLVQIPFGERVEWGLAGFRLAPGYAVVALGGAALLSTRRDDGTVHLLLAALAVPAGYAALRVLTGPSRLEHAFALSRPEGVPEYGRAFRAVGSFSGAVGLVSLLVPLAAFAFTLALAVPRHRTLGLAVSGSAVAAVIGSYTRVALVALATGIVLGVVAVLRSGFLVRRQRAVAAGVTALVLLGGVTATALASRGSPQLRERARGFVDPLDDPSVRQRLDTWEAAVRDAVRHPLGRGLGTVGRSDPDAGVRPPAVDNSYLKVAVEQGPAVALAFLGGLLLLGVATMRRLESGAAPGRGLGIAALAGSGAFLVLALAGDYAEQPGKVLAWALLGVAVRQAFAPPGDGRGQADRRPRRRVAALRSHAGSARAGWAAAAAALLVVPAGLSLLRTREYTTSFRVTPVALPDFPLPDDPSLYVRRLLTDNRFRREALAGSGLLVDKRTLVRRLEVTREGGAVRIQARADTPGRAVRLASAVRTALGRAATSELRTKIAVSIGNVRVLLAAPSRLNARRGLDPSEDRPALLGRVDALARLAAAPPRRLSLGPPAELPEARRTVDRAAERLPESTPPAPSVLLAASAGLLVLASAVAARLSLRGTCA